MILIGLTGGIACGKSSVSWMLHENHQIDIIDADVIVRELQGAHSPCTQQIARRWPQCVDTRTGELDRTVLGNIVFSDPAARRELAKIMNPAIFRAILWRIMRAWMHDLYHWCSRPLGVALKQCNTVVVLDAPTLFETKYFTFFCSGVVVVACSMERQIARLEKRNRYSREESLQRISSQMPLVKKCKLADYVIENESDNDLEKLQLLVQQSVKWMALQSNSKLNWIFGAGLVSVAGVFVTTIYVVYRSVSS